jgi:integrase
MYAAFRLVATTGMRRGEVLGLYWNDVDFDKMHISIQRTRISVAYAAIESQPKTAKGRRSVALDSETIEVLRRHRKQGLEERITAGSVWSGTDHVFTNELGLPIHPDAFSKLFERMVAQTRLPRLTLHGLRHTHATLALQDGWNPKIVSERLGHANIAITLDTYSHVTPGLQREMTESLAKRIDSLG